MTYNQSVISQIYELAKEKGMPISSPGLIMFSLNTKIPNKYNNHKAFIYDKPLFTEIHLLTHNQLERINKIIEEGEQKIEEPTIKKKEVSVIDFSKINSDRPERLTPQLEEDMAELPTIKREEKVKDNRKMTKRVKLIKHKQK